MPTWDPFILGNWAWTDVVEVVSRAVTIFDNRFTNITIYEMRHFTLIRELLTIFYRLFISLQAYLGERYCISVPPYPDSRWGTAFLQQNIWGNGVPPRSPSTTPLARAAYA